MTERTCRWTEAFDLASDTYDHPTRRLFVLNAEALVKEAQIPEGARVLDVATGTGNVALEAARTVGSRGRVVGIDLSTGMLAQARRKTGNLPVEFRQMDAEDLQFDDGIFDVVLCGFALFFFPDMIRGMHEMRRVLRRRGHVAFSTFARGALEPMRGITLAHLGRYGVAHPQISREPWMALNDPEHLHLLMEKGGLQKRRVVRKSTGYTLKAAEEWWGFVWGNGRWQKELRQLPPATLQRLRSEILAEVDNLKTGEGIWLDASALIGIGVRA